MCCNRYPYNPFGIKDVNCRLPFLPLVLYGPMLAILQAQIGPQLLSFQILPDIGCLLLKMIQVQKVTGLLYELIIGGMEKAAIVTKYWYYESISKRSRTLRFI